MPFYFGTIYLKRVGLHSVNIYYACAYAKEMLIEPVEIK